MRSTHELARLLLEEPDMPCLTFGSGSDGVEHLMSADFRTTELYIVNGEEIYDKDSYPAHRETAGNCVALQRCIIIE